MTHLCYKYAEQHEHLLPNGKYLFYFMPGDKDYITSLGGKYTVPDFSTKSSKTVREEEIDQKIEMLFKKIQKGERATVKLLNKNNDVFGRIFFSRKGKHSTVEYFFFPQKVRVSSQLEKADLKSFLQRGISKKEQNYEKRDLDQSNEWWLLLSDLEDEMNSDLINFDINDLNFKSNFFDKIFYIRKPYVECLIDELNI